MIDTYTVQSVSEIIDGLKDGTIDLDLNRIDHKNFISLMYNFYLSELPQYQKMYEYYKGNTDAMKNYKNISERSNLKTNTNYFKKFVKEEVSYTIGNPITYENLNNDDFLSKLNLILSSSKKNHDSDLMKYLVLFTKVFEIYGYNENGFNMKISTPLTGYSYLDENDKVLFYIETRIEHLDVDRYFIDVYTKKYIFHLNESFEQIKPPTKHRFGEVPVSVGILTEELYEDSLYKDIKGLQDAYETNLSDLNNEISDFRNAYLKMLGCEMSENDLKKAKELGIIQSNEKDVDINWLIKEINDSFVQNTLDRCKDDMYQIACHINHNEKMQSNLSGDLMRNRQIVLETKCTLQINSHKEIIANRLRFICNYLNYLEGTNYDYKKVKIIYTPNIPRDDLATAQMLSQTPTGIISKKTARSRYSFIADLDAEEKQVEKEYEEELKREQESLGDMYGNNHQEE